MEPGGQPIPRGMGSAPKASRGVRGWALATRLVA